MIYNTHFWPADPILWCMEKTPALERAAVKWLFPADFSLNMRVNVRNFGLPLIWSVGQYGFLPYKKSPRILCKSFITLTILYVGDC